MPAILLIVCCTLWNVYHYSSRGRWPNLLLPPGSMGLPIIGETLLFMCGKKQFFESRFKQHGEVYKTHILGSPIILMNENNLVTVFWPESVRHLLGKGSLTNSVGELHRTKRMALQKAFSHTAMSDYISIMQKVVQTCIKSWCSQEIVFGYQECKNMSFALAVEALLGFSLTPKEQRNLLDVYRVFENNLFSFPRQYPGFGFTKGMEARKTLLANIKECLELKMHKMNSNEGSAQHGFKDAMSRLLDNQGEHSVHLPDLMDLCLELLFAGHVTTASAATSILIYLNQHSEVVTKVQAELEEHGLAQSQELDLTLANLGHLRYVNGVVKEVLRLSPPVGAGYRTVLKSFTLNNYHIPAGWTIAYSIRETQQTSNIFEDTNKFNPDRWIDHKYPDEKFHFLPFGGGPRLCLGKEFAMMFLRVFVVEIVRSCSWELVEGSVKMSYFPVPHPKDGLPLRFSERVSST
ncbi:unnamed protein product [Candidula unifasciata]|uniref:Cytochrome P450 n=1 Tax=Candidula unifasciata TaxID=100452 RepID=A0A8S3ZQS1_9EUPU|nr:unnamed protein product [Candidula unifasciata]